MRKLFITIFIAISVWSCSGSIDTTELGPEEHFNNALSLFNDEDYEQCLTELQSILLQYPGSTINDDAQYYLGLTYFKRDQFLLAAYEFSKLIRNIPASEFVPESQYMLAESYYQLSPTYQLDQTYSEKGIQEFQAFIDFFPANSRVEEAEAKIKELNEKLAQKDYFSAYIYERMDYQRAAILYYTSITQTYHDTKYAPMALYKKINLLVSREEINEALNDIYIFLEKYPDDANAEEIRQLQSSLQSES